MARRCLSVLTVLAIAVPVCLYTSAILLILELGWGDPVPVDRILITHNYHIGSGVENVANKLMETAKERVAYVAARARLHSSAAAAQFVMENRRLGRTRSSSSNSLLLQTKQPYSRPGGVVNLENNGNPIPRPPAQRYQSNHHTSPYHEQPRVISIGPWGGRGGDPFRMRGTSVVPLLRSITVDHSSAAIHGLTYEYEYFDAGDKGFRRAGSSGLLSKEEASSAMINLLAGEYLTAVEGTTAYVGGSIVVTSLTFHTSRGTTYGPYGDSLPGIKTPFSVPAASGCIIGFWGRSGRLLDAIGVYIKPCAPKTTYNYPYSSGDWDESHGIQ